MKKLFDLNVSITDSVSVRGGTESVNMILFTAAVESEHFRGSTALTGTDTQTVSADGKCFLSARYMLDGTDSAGQKCRLFIENNGSFEDGFRPRIVTDSTVLRFLETAVISAEVHPQESGVIISFYADE